MNCNSGCDCNAPDQQMHDITPFMIAAAEGHDLIVDLMLKYVSISQGCGQI